MTEESPGLESAEDSPGSEDSRPIVLGIVGQTASGKGRLAREIGLRIGAEIISLDSMKLFRGLDIGTGKPSLLNRSLIPHHMIDVVDPDESFDVKRYVETARSLHSEIQSQGRTPLFCGGTALYLMGLLKGLFQGPAADPELRKRLKAEADVLGRETLHRRLASVDRIAASRIHPHDLRRIIRALEVVEKTGRPISELQKEFYREEGASRGWLAGIRWPREQLRERIRLRVDRMFEQGLVDEVSDLRSRGALGRWSRAALGYREVFDVLEGKGTLDEAKELIKRNTWRYSRQQMTWFRKIPEIRWFDIADTVSGDLALAWDELSSQVEEYLREGVTCRPRGARDLSP